MALALSGYFPEASDFAPLSLRFFACTVGIMLGLNEIKFVKSLLACLVHGQCASSLGFLPEIQVRVPQPGFGWLHLMSFSPQFQIGLLACGQGVYSKSIPVCQLRPRGCCEVVILFMELLCVTGCAQLLKCFDENAFVLRAL